MGSRARDAAPARLSEITRRQLLRGGTAGLAGLALGSVSRAEAGASKSLILVNLVGGPSQMESFDPKPDAPSNVRGPFGSIQTRIPGVRFCEHLPRLAARADRLAVIRSLHHEAAPIHETGLQLLQTGRLAHAGEDHPHLGAVAARLLGQTGTVPPFVVLPERIGSTGVKISHGQSAGPLGPRYEPWVPSDHGDDRQVGTDARHALDITAESSQTRARYGPTTFGRDCLRARRLVEAGTRVVVVNMFTTVFGRVSWDAHGRPPFSTLADYAAQLLPSLDQSLSALLDDLSCRGLLSETTLLATGEFGRSPRLNAYGGRDHWPGVWSGLIAGGAVIGNQVIGASDPQGGEPADRPVSLPDLLATLYQSIGLDSETERAVGAGCTTRLVDAGLPVRELLA